MRTKQSLVSGKVGHVVAHSVLSASTASPPEKSTGASDAPDVVTVGVVPVAEAIPLLIGIKEGFFEDAGIEIKQQSGQGGAALIASVASGSVDVGMAAGPPLLAATQGGVGLQIISAITAPGKPEGDPYFALLVQADSAIQSPADLEGKTVAVNGIKGNSEMYVLNAVKKDGGDPSAVQFTEVGWPDQATALRDGRVDAVAISEPFLTPAVDKGARVLADIAGETLGADGALAYWFTSDQKAQADPDMISRFTKAMDKAMAYANDHPDEAATQYAQFAKIPEDVASRLTLPRFGPRWDIGQLQRDANLMRTFGFVETEIDPTPLLKEAASG